MCAVQEQDAEFNPIGEFEEYYNTVILAQRSQAEMQWVVATDEAKAYCRSINFGDNCFCTVAGLADNCSPLVGVQSSSFIELDATSRSRVLAAASEQPAESRVRSRSRASPSLVPLE